MLKLIEAVSDAVTADAVAVLHAIVHHNRTKLATVATPRSER